MAESQLLDRKRTVGTFYSREDADMACDRLRHAGFSDETISIEIQNLDPNPTINKTQASKSAMGGAIAGTLFGVMVSLLITLTARQVPGETAIGPIMSPFPVILLCAIVGMAGGALIAGLAGANVPKTELNSDREALTNIYLVMMEGSAEELGRAADLLQGAVAS